VLAYHQFHQLIEYMSEFKSSRTIIETFTAMETLWLNMDTLDLCVGAGGLSLGLEQAGHRVITGVDVWDDALNTYRHNHSSVGLKADLHNTEPSELPLSHNQVELVAGGPPCKGFSLAGKRDEEDDRNQLIARFLDYVEYFEPQEVIMENVTGILSMNTGDGQNLPEYINRRLSEMGYSVDQFTLSADDYGLAQARERVFFRGSMNSNPVKPEPTTANETLPVSDILYRDFDGLPNHNITNHQQSTIDKMAKLDYEESVYDYGEAWKRLNPEKPSITIKENHGAPFVHPKKDRVGTPRECAAIQGFPDNYKFTGSKSSVLKQIGNAVPPVLGKAVGETL
jgi:DNA (cytosine-5)-methyltransferase 1